jgi:mRNA interferase RelE/StbE
MNYEVQIAPGAKREIKKLPREVSLKITLAINELATNPRPMGVTKLRGEDDLYRIRVGDYRVIYQVHDDVLIVLVLAFGHRREVYRDLK